MTRDIATPLTVSMRVRLRQTVIWSAIAIFIAIYFMASRISSRVGGGRGGAATDLLELALLLSWAVASLGFRTFLPSLALPAPARSTRLFPEGAITLPLLRFGTAVIDALIVVAGTLLVAAICGMAPRGPREATLLLMGAVLIGASTSLQLEIMRLFANRAMTLLTTALLTAAALLLVHATPPLPAALLGRLGFPVSALVSATEEPLRLDLAARALAAGVTYDLALVATLFALPGHRARG
jgi:hypothetical protein